MTVEFGCRTHLEMGALEAFDRSRSIDLHIGSMSDSCERAIAGVTTGLIGPGEEVTWRAWHFGLPIRMTSRITEFIEPTWFVDEQVRGPFRAFRHEHTFEPDGADATIMTDRVRFTAPLGVLGRTGEFVLGPYLHGLIERRNEHLAGSSAR